MARAYIKPLIVFYFYLFFVRKFFIYKFGTYEGEIKNCPNILYLICLNLLCHRKNKKEN